LPLVLLPTLAVAAASFLLVERPVLRVVERALRDGRRRRAAASVTRRPAPVRA
jgi:peptidoglycan/LPS O-acetylase OafA/YrhL